MNPVDAMHVAGPFADCRSRLDGDESGTWHEAITSRADTLVQQARPIVADVVGAGRMGLGTLLAPADPLVILDGLGYRLDAAMAASRVSPLERLRWATVVDFRHARRFSVEHSVRGANVAHLAAHLFGALPQIVALELSGTFSGVTVPNGAFGRADGSAVGFITSTGSEAQWHLSFITADRTFGGPILELSLENVGLQILSPQVVYRAGTREEGNDVAGQPSV